MINSFLNSVPHLQIVNSLSKQVFHFKIPGRIILIVVSSDLACTVRLFVIFSYQFKVGSRLQRFNSAVFFHDP